MGLRDIYQGVRGRLQEFSDDMRLGAYTISEGPELHNYWGEKMAAKHFSPITDNEFIRSMPLVGTGMEIYEHGKVIVGGLLTRDELTKRCKRGEFPKADELDHRV